MRNSGSLQNLGLGERLCLSEIIILVFGVGLGVAMVERLSYTPTTSSPLPYIQSYDLKLAMVEPSVLIAIKRPKLMVTVTYGNCWGNEVNGGIEL